MPLPRFARRPRHWNPLAAFAAATDTLVDAYVAWRDACAGVRTAYGRLHECEPSDRDLTFAAYLAALEGEEHAAYMYARQLERVRHMADWASDHEAWKPAG